MQTKADKGGKKTYFLQMYFMDNP